MLRSKPVRLSGPAQDVLQTATADLPEGTTVSQRILVLAERARRAGTGHAATAPDAAAGPPADQLIRPSQPASATPAGGDPLTEPQLQKALQALRYQLLSDFADAG